MSGKGKESNSASVGALSAGWTADERPLQRQLGPIETMYHHAVLRGEDKVSVMLLLESTVPLKADNIRQAVLCLAKRHPLLRMSIREDPPKGQGRFRFVEMKRPCVDLKVFTDVTDWYNFTLEQNRQHIDFRNGPLWNCRVMNLRVCRQVGETHNSETDTVCQGTRTTSLGGTQDSNTGSIAEGNDCQQSCSSIDKDHGRFGYQGRVIFTWHHAIMDGGYLKWVLGDFFSFLAAINIGRNVTPGRVKSLPFMPSIERALRLPPDASSNCCSINSANVNPADTKFWVERSNYENAPSDVLDHYNVKYSADIKRLSSAEPINKYKILELTRQQTRDVIRQCKLQRTTVNGAIWAASVAAFVDMLYGAEALPLRVSIPFEFIFDIRKHYPLEHGSDVTSPFSGVATTQLPMAIECSIDSSPLGHMEFWDFARAFSTGIKGVLQSLNVTDVLNGIRKENNHSTQGSRLRGKSPFVICVSNMGVMDPFLADDVTRHLKLVEMQGTSSILIDDMPIFLIGVSTLNGKLLGICSYCANYTSAGTVSEYTRRLQSYLVSRSKL